MFKLVKKNKLALFRGLVNIKNVFGGDDYNIIEFLEEIWDLRSMSSTDERFDDALGNITQHFINNDDWDLETLFIDKLKLLDDNRIYVNFLETILLPKFKNNNEETIVNFVNYINPYLEKDNYKLAITDYTNDGLPLYSVLDKSDLDDLPNDIKVNNILFYVIKYNSGYANNQTQHLKDSEVAKNSNKPFFALYFESGWNDYGIMSSFYLYYYNNKNVLNLGETKIITNDDSTNTNRSITSPFTNLSNSFCSPGQSSSYYIRLKELLGHDFLSVLFALKDAAFFPVIQEKFEKKPQYKDSLIRTDKVERLAREIKYIINGYDLLKLYSFEYYFIPLFSKNDGVKINFNFDNNADFPNRIYAIIGKNGTGKTQLITSLPIDISQRKANKFSPKLPIFSKVISVSYSVFDRFVLPKKSAEFNYVYCGLRKDNGEFISERGLINRFHYTWKNIVERGRMKQWRKILLTFIEEEIVSQFLIKNSVITNTDNDYKMDIAGFSRIRDKLSSGQGIILYIITEIVANIRFDSLIIYDEPETHLHPNAITQLMNTIYELVEEFQSYCIIATHSPLIVRELPSRNVYIMERNANVSSIRRIALESLGENLTSITEEIFGNKEIKKQSKTIFERLVDNGKTFDEITSIIEFDEIPLSLNARILIKNLIRERNEEL